MRLDINSKSLSLLYIVIYIQSNTMDTSLLFVTALYTAYNHVECLYGSHNDPNMSLLVTDRH